MIPQRIVNDREWRATLFLFAENAKLKQLFTTRYFDFKEGIIHFEAMKRQARPWSSSERFMLNLAIHLYNSKLAKIDLSDMDMLDHNNKALVFEALRLRFN